MATSMVLEEQKQPLPDVLVSPTPPRMRRARLPTTSGALGLSDRYNYGTIIHNRIFIGGLHSSVTEEDLRAKFQEYGEISDVKIIKKPEQEKGYAFITFEAPEVAKKVLEESGQRVRINGMDSKVGPAIRKPSSDSSSQISPAGMLKKPDIVLQPLVTPKRNRLASCPDGGSDYSFGSYDPSNPAQIPVPMSASVANGSQAPNPTPDSAFLAQNMNSMAHNQECQKLLLAYRLAQASSVNPIVLQALMNQMASPALSPFLSPSPAAVAANQEQQVFFPGTPSTGLAAAPSGNNSIQQQQQSSGLSQSLLNVPGQITSPATNHLMSPQVQTFFGQNFDQNQQLQHQQQQQMTLNAATQILAAHVSSQLLGTSLGSNDIISSPRNQLEQQAGGLGVGGLVNIGNRQLESLGTIGQSAVGGGINVSGGMPSSNVSGQQQTYSGVAQGSVGGGLMQSPGMHGGILGDAGFQSGYGGSFQFNIETTSSPEFDA